MKIFANKKRLGRLQVWLYLQFILRYVLVLKTLNLESNFCLIPIKAFQKTLHVRKYPLTHRRPLIKPHIRNRRKLTTYCNSNPKRFAQTAASGHEQPASCGQYDKDLKTEYLDDFLRHDNCSQLASGSGLEEDSELVLKSQV